MKKAQIQMMETISVLIVFFVLLMIGFVFYSNFAKTEVTKDVSESQQLASIKVAQRIAFLPELQCSENNIIKDDCFDIIKLEALDMNTNSPTIIFQNGLYYFDEFENSIIKVKQIYPIEQEWMIYERKLPQATKYQTYIPISLFDPKTGTYNFGILNISTYIK